MPTPEAGARLQTCLKERNEWSPQDQEEAANILQFILRDNPLLKAVEEQLTPVVYPPKGVITLLNFEQDLPLPPTDKVALVNWGGTICFYPSPEALAAGKSACGRKMIFVARKWWEETNAKVIQIGHLASGNVPVAIHSSFSSSYRPELKGIFIGTENNYPNLSHRPLIALRITLSESGQPEWRVGVRKNKSKSGEPYGNYSWREPSEEEKGLFELKTEGETASLSATPAFAAAPGFRFEIEQKYLTKSKNLTKSKKLQ